MDEKKDMCNCGMCSTGMGHMHHHFGFWVVKLLVALVALLFVFWLGVKVGEVKSFMGGYGRIGGRNMMYLQQGMPGWQTTTIVPQSMMTTGKATTTPVK